MWARSARGRTGCGSARLGGLPGPGGGSGVEWRRGRRPPLAGRVGRKKEVEVKEEEGEEREPHWSNVEVQLYGGANLFCRELSTVEAGIRRQYEQC